MPTAIEAQSRLPDRTRDVSNPNLRPALAALDFEDRGPALQAQLRQPDPRHSHQHRRIDPQNGDADPASSSGSSHAHKPRAAVLLFGAQL